MGKGEIVYGKTWNLGILMRNKERLQPTDGVLVGSIPTLQAVNTE